MNLARLISETATKYADKPAIIFEGKTWTYQDFDRQVKNYAATIKQLGITKGDRVAIQLPKSIEFLFWHFASIYFGTLPASPSVRSLFP